MAAERSHRYLGSGVDQLNPASGGDQFEFDEADIWKVGEIILPEGGKTVLSSSRTLRIPARRRVDVDRLPVGSKSLPVNIPNWFKIVHSECITRASDRGGDREGDEEGGNDHKIPPHEYLARTRVASMSVQEGVGRTLKGRDLSNLRNAVLKKTGIED
ncbi:protein S40-4-like [Primulina eburnea]|uniref:protein S40-4-like n=1 Tax=Primulina eburnea TaxID=1245227 RepID=UPI003C6C66A9